MGTEIQSLDVFNMELQWRELCTAFWLLRDSCSPLPSNNCHLHSQMEKNVFHAVKKRQGR